MRKLLLILMLTVIIILLGVFLLSKNKENLPVTEIEVTSKELYANMQEKAEELDKMYNFIESNLPYGAQSVYTLEVHDSEEVKGATLKELRREVVDLFNLSIDNNDLDLFLSTISSESIREIVGDEENIEKRISLLYSALDKLNRNGLFQKAPYQFEINKTNQEMDSGFITFIYSDGKEVKTHFELELVVDMEEKFYNYKSSIIDLLKLLE